jgi:LytS/YehU family sensor histidine kinase
MADYIGQKIIAWQKMSSKQTHIHTILLFTFHFSFGFIFAFLANFLYRLGDIYLFHNKEGWRDVTVFNPELTMSLLLIYMMVFSFDNYYNASIKTNEDKLQLEKLKRENTLAQYLNLKSQIEPHFLFNSLSVLSSVIHSDTNLASEFTIRLSRILRYMIEKNEHILVPLKDEISFVDNYFFLIQTRFQEGIIFKNNLHKRVINSSYIPPASLQMLIENAVKHNKFTKKYPLEIIIENDEENLVVTNNLNIRDDIKNSTRLGLENLKERFRQFTSSHVVIEETESQFKVSLPILTKLHYERFNI